MIYWQGLETHLCLKPSLVIVVGAIPLKRVQRDTKSKSKTCIVSDELQVHTVFFLYSGSAFIYLTFFLFLDRMCGGPSTLEKKNLCVTEPIGVAKVTPMPLNHIDTKYDEMTLFHPQRKLHHNQTT